MIEGPVNMSSFVWCDKEQRRVPTYRCRLCDDRCRNAGMESPGGERVVQLLIFSGKLKERFVMRKKEKPVPQNQIVKEAERIGGTDDLVDTDVEKGTESPEPSEIMPGGVFILEEGRLKPFPRDAYTVSTLYEMAEAYEVDCRLVKPDDPGNIIYEGRKPSKKTLPVIVKNTGETLFLDSWSALDSDPSQLSDAREVLGVVPMKQVFVLKKKDV